MERDRDEKRDKREEGEGRGTCRSREERGTWDRDEKRDRCLPVWVSAERGQTEVPDCRSTHKSLILRCSGRGQRAAGRGGEPQGEAFRGEHRRSRVNGQRDRTGGGTAGWMGKD